MVINFSKAVIACHRFHFCGKKKPPFPKRGGKCGFIPIFHRKTSVISDSFHRKASAEGRTALSSLPPRKEELFSARNGFSLPSQNTHDVHFLISGVPSSFSFFIQIFITRECGSTFVANFCNRLIFPYTEISFPFRISFKA